MSGRPNDLSPVLHEAADGSAAAARQISESLYAELHRLAEYTMAGERRDHTLAPSGLVHETFLRLVDQRNLSLEHRSKYLAIAAGAMRRVLVDYARARKAQKRGGEYEKANLELNDIGFEEASRLDVLAVDEALDQLASEHERAAKVVEMRFFSGMSNEEIAQEMAVSTRTVQNDWVFAKAWLYRAINGSGP